MNIQEFMAANPITIRHKRTNSDHALSADCDTWRVQLSLNGRKLTIPFSQGFGFNGEPPKLETVLECLASDAAGFENADGFEDWAAEYGYDTDSRKAFKTYKQVEKQTEKLRAFLGNQYETLLWEVSND